MQLHDPSLVLQQTGEGLGEPQELLAADGPLARGGLVGCEQAFQSGSGAIQLGLQRSLSAGIAGLGAEPSGRGGQGVRQDGAEPGQPLAFGPAPELVPPLVGLQDRLLDDVRGVEFRAGVARFEVERAAGGNRGDSRSGGYRRQRSVASFRALVNRRYGVRPFTSALYSGYGNAGLRR